MTSALFPGQNLPPHFDPVTVAAIEGRLLAVEGREKARLLFAIESGSRAWGFPSPDSDYDCRFVYVRPPAAYLALRPVRDVIEFPLVGDLDVNGWDLRKALRLALAGNAVIGEWADAPIVYADPHGFKAELQGVLRRIVDPRLVARHYAGLVSAHRSRFDVSGPMPLKKLFYLIRPVAVLRWMELRDFDQLPPMHLPTVLASLPLEETLRSALDDLLARKAATRELVEGVPPDVIRDFVVEGFALSDVVTHRPRPAAGDGERRAVADAFFLGTLGRVFPGPLSEVG